MTDARSNPHSPTGHTVADQLAHEARAQEARMLPDEGPLTPEQLAWARAAIGTYVQERGLALKAVAKQAAIGESTLSFWLSDKYSGNNDRIARTLVRWMRQHQDGERSGMPVGYVSTRVAERMLGVLRAVQRTGTMGAVVGPSGTSKSVVCRAAASGLIVGAAHVELTVAHRSPSAVARLLSHRLMNKNRHTSMAHAVESLIEHLAGSGRLLIIDEAHFMSRGACTLVRDVHKQTGCPVVLVGTRDVLDTVNDFDEFRGQFSRLFSYVYNVTAECQATGDPLYTVDEVARLAKSMGLRLTGDGAELLTELTNILGWGGLGKCAMLLLNARLLAGEAAISERHLSRALREMEGAAGFERVELRRKRAEPRAACA